MKTVIIKEGFDAYPKGELVTFTAGDEPTITNDLADLLAEKGLATIKPDQQPATDEGDHT